jgi:cellulose synthase/poly-beta-1,6-N-acetylglucosamine synthase-like glycosyltransferase
VLEIIPGLLTWGLILSPIWLGILYPTLVIYMLTFLSVYWAYLAVKHFRGLYIGYKKYQAELTIDWWSECVKLSDNWEALPDPATRPRDLASSVHFLLIPTYNEPADVIKNSIDSIFAQTLPHKQILLVCAVEEKYAQRVLADIDAAIGDRKKELYGFYAFVHPAKISGEAVGAGGANRTWGARHAVDDLINQGLDIKNFIFSTIDGDHVMHPQYLARLAHLYLSADKRNNHFYSTAVHLFSNNYWRVPTVMRIEASSVTLAALSNWISGIPQTRETFSAYSSSLQTLIDADYWDVAMGIDDTVFYWRAFFVRNGDFTGICHYIPYSADAVEGTGYFNSYQSLYKQLLRWGWGVIVFPLSVRGFVKHRKIPLSKKLIWIYTQLKSKTLLVSIVFLVTFGFYILTATNKYVKQSNFAYSLPYSISIMLSAILVLIIPITILKTKIVGGIPKSLPWWRKIMYLMEGPLIVINLLTFSFFPFLEAQTRMLLGKKMKDLYFTPKMARK